MDWQEVIIHHGNEELERFIRLGILAAQNGIPLHFHAEGVRGTGKTTLIRAARSCLPQIEKISGCQYNCDPGRPHCPEHAGVSGMATELVAMPFLEISHSAKVGTVAGSIDLDKLIAANHPAAALLPGTLPRAHRGIVFVDEINRLADTSPHLVDILLDVMGTKPGRVQIEETGLPTVEVKVLASVWAASNPDEEPGPLQEIRRQLADRFDFAVRVERPENPENVRAIIKAQKNISIPRQSWGPIMPLPLSAVTLDEQVEQFLSEAYIRFRLESIRGIQAACLGALLHAASCGRKCAGFEDLVVVLPAALRHRLEYPRLVEIMEAVKSTMEREKQKMSAVLTVKPAKGVEKRAKAGYPALWQGLWQRLSRQSGQCQGKDVVVNCPDGQEDKALVVAGEKKSYFTVGWEETDSHGN